jgi:hypothetical protein
MNAWSAPWKNILIAENNDNEDADDRIMITSVKQ